MTMQAALDYVDLNLVKLLPRLYLGRRRCSKFNIDIENYNASI